MSEGKQQPELSAYLLAWLVWYFALTIPVVLLATALYIVNMFAAIIPAYGALFAFEAGLAVLFITLLGIASVSVYRKRQGRPAWEPWPIPTLARKMQVLVDLVG